MLTVKAKQLAEGANLEGFTGSSGWLQRFKNRYAIRSKGLHGEAADADAHGVQLSQRSLPALISDLDYSKEDVFNFDETGLYFKAPPKRTLLRGECTLPCPAQACFVLAVGSPHTPDPSWASPIIIPQCATTLRE